MSSAGEVADDRLTELYLKHYTSLLRLASLLIDSPAAREDVVQEAYVRVFVARGRLRDQDKALAFLRQTVVNLSRSSLRRRLVARKHAPKFEVDQAQPDFAADSASRDAVRQALARLPRRQREAVVLRYFGDLTEAQTALAMGCGVGSVKAYCSRALKAMSESLEGFR